MLPTVGRAPVPAGVFRDSMGYVEGLDDLVEYIGLALMAGSNRMEFGGDGLIRTVVGFWSPPAGAGEG